MMTAEKLHQGFLTKEKLSIAWMVLYDLEMLYKIQHKPQEEIDSLIKARKLVYEEQTQALLR